MDMTWRRPLRSNCLCLSYTRADFLDLAGRLQKDQSQLLTLLASGCSGWEKSEGKQFASEMRNLSHQCNRAPS